jgi:molybdopterin-guanine dinucleotide biosynthesis protein A
MNAIVTAGGKIEPGQPLYEITHGGQKALIDIAGRPMVQWVLDALGKSSALERVFVIGLPLGTELTCAHPLVLLPDQGNMLANITAAAREVVHIDPQATHALLASGDLPALGVEMVDWLLGQVKDLDQDIYYTVVSRGTMETCFPASRRTYVPMKDIEVCGGDLHCFRLDAANEENSLIKQLIGARKSPLRQASMIGFSTLFWLVLRQLSLRDVETAVCQRLELRGRVLVSPYPEIGMDVDKPFQLDIIREYFARGYEHNAAKTESI